MFLVFYLHHLGLIFQLWQTVDYIDFISKCSLNSQSNNINICDNVNLIKEYYFSNAYYKFNKSYAN